jgi:hypothetical protein
MTELPHFYCMKTLLGYGGEDLNRITLYGPNGFEFVLYGMGEKRPTDAGARCNALAARLHELWQKENPT